MTMTQDSAKFIELFKLTYRYFCRHVKPSDYQLSMESMAILTHLEEAGPLTIQEAAAHFSRSQSATSEMVERLERRHLLVRIPDERDKRRHLIWIAPEGRTVLAEAQQILSEEKLQAALTRMSTPKRQQLLEGLELLIKSAAEHPNPNKE